jgi:hypothetical protein
MVDVPKHDDCAFISSETRGQWLFENDADYGLLKIISEMPLPKY